MLVCWLIFAGYMMLRRAIEEPDTPRPPLRRRLHLRLRRHPDRLEIDRVVPHPAPRAGAQRPRRRRHGPRHGNAHLLELADVPVPRGVLMMIRMRQEQRSREIDSLRRLAHSY